MRSHLALFVSSPQINLRQTKLGPEGGKAIAKGIQDSRSLTQVRPTFVRPTTSPLTSYYAFVALQISLANNQLCGLDFVGNGTYTDVGIKAIATAMGVSHSLTAADLRYNSSMGSEAEQMLRDCVKERPSFDLEL